ncbi:MAG: accessory gene regulator B family protein [Lachnospiraceae bacterium]|nr:accessory gene regulator B family protein [Ruminococcus sp.]MCM1276256.1 accessory gene regulator B family protein [Lachnospiraceae bacterium]
MGLLAKLSQRIGNDLVRSNVIEADDAEIYIYGINQILVSVINVSSALIIGLLFGTILEIVVFMAAYIPLRSFAGGFHAKTPLRCYIYSLIMLIIVSMGLKYLHIEIWGYYAVLSASVLIVLALSPVEDKNKPLDDLEYKVYKKRAIIIAAVELVISVLLKLIGLDNLFIAVVYSFVVLGFMLIIGAAKNALEAKNTPD